MAENALMASNNIIRQNWQTGFKNEDWEKVGSWEMDLIEWQKCIQGSFYEYERVKILQSDWKTATNRAVDFNRKKPYLAFS